MYLTGEQPKHADRVMAQLQFLSAQLLDGLVAVEAPVQVMDPLDIGVHLEGDHVYLIISGDVQVWLDSRPVFCLGPGDLLGLHDQPDLPGFRYGCDAPLLLQPFSRVAVLEHVRASNELTAIHERLLVAQMLLLADALASVHHPDLSPNTGYQHFAAGEELIHQGDEADNVFIIVEGYAEAYVDGHRVGDVCKDEIFGAMAVFTGEKRSATVVASEPCTVMVIPKEQFIALMHSNPKIAHSLIESLARRITLLNQEVTRLRTV